MKELTADISNDAFSFKEQTQEAWSHASDLTTQKLQEGRAIIRANPVPAIAGAFALGLALALMIPSRTSPPERFLDGRLEDLKELLNSTTRNLGRMAEESPASSWFLDGFKKIKSSLNF